MSILLMGGSNVLYYPTAGAGFGAQRAYFRIGDGDIPQTRGINAFNIDFGDGETVSGFISMDNGQWYSIDGRKISNGQKPTAQGLYINNGKKVVIK
jgi:hypothetical protein